MTENPIPVVEPPPSPGDKARGLPLWIPLLGLLVAFLIALFVGVQIVPTLSAVIAPPNPPLPTTGTMTVLLREQKGAGLDEFLYGTDQKGCDVARFYESRLGDCTYDPDSACQTPGGTRPIQPGLGQLVAQCTGTDSIGAYRLRWTVYISTGYTQGGQTHFRVVREVGN